MIKLDALTEEKAAIHVSVGAYGKIKLLGSWDHVPSQTKPKRNNILTLQSMTQQM